MTSYGRKSVFMFCGAPSADNYAKNLSDGSLLTSNALWEKQVNPYVSPTMVATALRFMPKTKDLANYKFRGLQDGAFIYEGYCILPPDAVEKVKMVPDLVRDANGTPIKDDNGEFQVSFREALPEELSEDKKTYMAKPDYLAFMKEKAIEYGYLKQDGSEKAKNVTRVKSVLDPMRMEWDVSKENITRNLPDMASSWVEKLKSRISGMFSGREGIETSAEEVLKGFSFKGKNPYRNKNFSLAIADFQQKEGIVQADLGDVLPEFTRSEEGEFFSKKYSQIEGNITRMGIHGKGHSDRVAILAMMIAKNEGMLENDNDNRIKDILSTAAMYHDIGRLLDAGPHALSGAIRIALTKLKFSDGKPYSREDKKMVMALVESHEGKPEKIDKLIKRYKLDPADAEIARSLSSAIRDADALDRARLDLNTPIRYSVNLKPKYLVNDTSKGLINAAYQLEFLTRKVPNRNNILTFGKAEPADQVAEVAETEQSFDDRLRVDYVPTPNAKLKDANSSERNQNRSKNDDRDMTL